MCARSYVLLCMMRADTVIDFITASELNARGGAETEGNLHDAEREIEACRLEEGLPPMEEGERSSVFADGSVSFYGQVRTMLLLLLVLLLLLLCSC